MTIHTLQDLCYAYSVADPVREMLFALQDRIDALEAQRKPLTERQARDIVEAESWGPDAITLNLQLLRTIRRTEDAHGIKEGT